MRAGTAIGRGLLLCLLCLAEGAPAAATEGDSGPSNAIERNELAVHGDILPGVILDLRSNPLPAGIVLRSDRLIIPSTALDDVGPELRGLASFFSQPRPIVVSEGGVEVPEPGTSVPLSEEGWFGWRDQSHALLIRLSGRAPVVERLSDDILELRLAEGATWAEASARLYFGPLDQFGYSNLKYSGLWGPLQPLCQAIDWLLGQLWSVTGNLGVAIILLAFVIKALLMPLSITQIRLQQRAQQIRRRLEPHLLRIKSHYDGEEAHRRIMEAHKAEGVTPFYAMKPALLVLLQLPVLIAIFAALGEYSEGVGEPFLWVSDLAVPDRLVDLPLFIPAFGDQLSLMPILLGLITAASPLAQKLQPGGDRPAAFRSAGMMGAAFAVLFYPFPSALVLYWASANALQIAVPLLVTSSDEAASTAPDGG